MLDYTGRQLVLELAGGRQQTYPAAQVALTSPRYVQSLPAGEVSRASLLSSRDYDLTETGVEAGSACVSDRH